MLEQNVAHWEYRAPHLQGLPSCSWVKLKVVIGFCCILSGLRTVHIALEFLDLGVSDEKEATGRGVFCEGSSNVIFPLVEVAQIQCIFPRDAEKVICLSRVFREC